MVTTRKRSNHIVLIIELSLIITVSIFFSCIVPAEPPINEFKMSIASGQDTVSPYSDINISFTERLKDTSATFQFDPPFFSFLSIVNKSEDTISIMLADPLPGETCFALRPVNEIRSESGQVIKVTDSVVLHVYPTEHEPNDNIATADTLKRKIYGSIATVNDTDFFVIPASAKTVYLKTFSSHTSFKVKDSKGQFSRPCLESDTLKSDTLTIPVNLIAPLFLVVNSYNKSVGGYYETGFPTKIK
jgi:hypothetical protein